MADETFRPTLALDFDGVVNPYSKGWQDGQLYEPGATPGFWPWLEHASQCFRVVVHSSRFGDPAQIDRVRDWLRRAWMCSEEAQRCYATMPPDLPITLPPPWLQALEFSATKPPAWLTVDDRCVRFDGRWDAPELRPDALLAFRPWTQRAA